MTHDPYGDAELVTLYDSDNPGGRDHAFYRALADELGATTVVDLGCGTGLLTRSFAAPGRTVVGVDPSATMLDFARRQPGAGGVRWILGDATALPGSGDVDLVVCTGNAIQHISTEELPTALIHIAGALRRGGIVSFESRNPSFREWERWTPQATVGERETPFGHLREWLEVTSVDDARRVVFDAHNIVNGGPVRTFTSELHFRTGQQFTDQLTAAGFAQVEIAGDWEHGPVTDASPIMVVRAVRS